MNGVDIKPNNPNKGGMSSPSSDSGSESGKALKISGKWSDYDAPETFFDDDVNDFDGRSYAPPISVSPVHRTPSPKTVSSQKDFNDPKYDAPVLWIRRTYGLSSESICEAILATFEESAVENVKIVSLYINSGNSRDHAYLVLNSDSASQLLLDGTLTVVIQKEVASDSTEKSEEVSLAIDAADNITPSDEQDPYTLYLWQLPRDRPAAQVEDELIRRIVELSPIKEIELPSDSKGLCIGWAKVVFMYEKDTQKCIYMLNFNKFMNVGIRAGFYQLNRPPLKKPIPTPAAKRTPPAPRKQNPHKSPVEHHPRKLSFNGESPELKTRQRSIPTAAVPPAKLNRQKSVPDSIKVNKQKPGNNEFTPVKTKGKPAVVIESKPEKKEAAPKNVGWQVIGREGRSN